MSVINEITKAVTDTAKTAAKISSEMVEVTKLNVAISVEEDKISKQFFEIGKKVYGKYASKSAIDDNDIIELCELIKDMERNIAEMRTRIFNLKKIKECPVCKEILDIDMAFCFKCGARQPVVEIIIEETEVSECEELACDEVEANEQLFDATFDATDEEEAPSFDTDAEG